LQKSEFIWMDGEYLKWDDAQISVMSHTLHYGTGVFEGIRARETSIGTAIFRLKDHIERLFSSAEAYNLEIPYSYDEIFDASKSIVLKNKLKDAYIRPLVFFW
jgi:branched-chain amino acid aminotransferase